MDSKTAHLEEINWDHIQYKWTQLSNRNIKFATLNKKQNAGIFYLQKEHFKCMDTEFESKMMKIDLPCKL